MADITDLAPETETPLTQADYERATKLYNAIQKATAELEALKDRIKAEHANTGTFVHGNVIVKRGEQNRVVLDETEKNFLGMEDFWETKQVLDIAAAKKKHPELVVTKTIPTVSITFAD